MIEPPALMAMNDYADWLTYEDAIYAVYLRTVAHAGLRFCDRPVRVRFRPETKRKGYGFWHLISEAPDQKNRNEDARIPDLRRCERMHWIAWCIRNANEEGFSWWENQRGRETHVVIWAEAHDFVVILAKRLDTNGVGYYLLKTAYCPRAHTIRKLEKERDAWLAAQKD